MNWTINVTASILLTSITGSILFGVWYTIGKILERTGFINVMYELLKAILLFWFFPISYFILIIMNQSNWGGFLFRYTTTLGLICDITCCIWILIASIMLFKTFIEVWLLNKQFHRAFPIDNEVYDYYLTICNELKIAHGKVDLVYDCHAQIPYIGGLIHNYIALPNIEYSHEQLRIIFIHELTHYKQRNHYLRHLTSFALAIHFFNPFMWLFKRKVRYWGEYACDFEVLTKIKGKRHYFEVIQDISCEDTISQMLSSHLFESKNELESRMKLVQRSYKMKKKPKLFALFVVLGMSTISTISVEAATTAIGNNYYHSYFQTVNVENEVATEIEGIEYEATGFEEGVIVTQDSNSGICTYALSSYNWTIKANRAQSSSNFKASSGQSITVSAVASPNSAQIRMGIIEPDGTLRYVAGSGSVLHTFALDQTGTYAIYVQNMSDGSISVGGFYNVE